MDSARSNARISAVISRSLSFLIILAAIAAAQPEAAAAAADTVSSADRLREGVETFADFLLKYFIALAAVGALAMALMELWKKLRESRTRYHAKVVTEWVGGSQEAYGELLHLATGLDLRKAAEAAADLKAKQGSLPFFLGFGRQEHALFALELDQMLGHMQDAVDVALSSPVAFPRLYAFITEGSRADGEFKDAAAWKEMAEPPTSEISAEESKRRADLYARLHQLAKRKLDALQLFAGRKWVNWNQLWANMLGIAIMFFSLLWLRAQGHWNGSFPAMLLLSAAGGILSPLAKDIVIALKKARGG